MTNSETLASLPTPFEYDSKTYRIGVADYEAELFYQARQEAWVRNRIEATASMVSDQVYRTDVDAFNRQRAGNLFAFGSPLSMQWLVSDEGFCEYVALLSAKGKKDSRGGPVFSKEQLAKLRRQDRPAWDRLVEMVLRRDFPNLMAPASSAEPTPSSTMSASSNCCPENPGSWADAKSSALAPATSVP